MVMKNKALTTLYIFNGFFVLAGAMLAPIFAFFAEDIGASIFQVSLLATAFLFSKIIFTLIVRKFGDNIQEKEYLLLGGFFVRSIAWFSLVFVSSIPALFLIQILLGVGEALGNPAFDSIFAKHLDEGKQIKEYSEWGIVATLGAGIGTLVGGYIVTNYGFQPLFITMSIIALISFFGILFKPRNLL